MHEKNPRVYLLSNFVIVAIGGHNSMKITCMSKPKSSVAAGLEQRTRQICLHLIKLHLYPENESCNHWRREVANQLNEVDRLKKSNKYPSSQFIYDNTYKLHKKYISKYIAGVLMDYGDSIYDVDEYLISDKVRFYFVWISERLSKDGWISYSEIYEHLKQSGF